MSDEEVASNIKPYELEQRFQDVQSFLALDIITALSLNPNQL